MTFPFTIKIISPGDARGWIALGCFVLVIVVLFMIMVKPSLLENDAFLILATAIVITGWVNGPVGWAYQATKGGGEAAESSARIAETSAGVPAGQQPAANGAAPAGTEGDAPTEVVVVNPPHEPVPITPGKKP